MFPFKNNVLEKAEFPKKFPFSAMVPNVYHEVKEFIYAVLKFTEDLNLKLVLNIYSQGMQEKILKIS